MGVFRLHAGAAHGRSLVEGGTPKALRDLRALTGYTPALHTDVAQHYKVPHRPGAIDTAVARYLAGARGCLIWR